MRPKHLIVDQGSEFKCEHFEHVWCKALDILPRFGAVGKHGSIAVVERFHRTLKELLRLSTIPENQTEFEHELELIIDWYNEHRPHETLDGKAYPRLNVHLVPVGHVMYELDQRMKAGQVSGYTTIWQVYKDGIHLDSVGSYVVGCTYLATLYRQDPQGLSSEPYKVTDPKLAEVIQDTVWKVVSQHELAGVAKSTVIGTKTNMQGWELYVWQQDGDNYFALLLGTNRLKTDTEIAAAAVKGIDAIKHKLDELKAGETLIPCGRRLTDRAADEPAKEIEKYCRKLGLDVQR
jgi:hypothetical protein